MHFLSGNSIPWLVEFCSNTSVGKAIQYLDPGSAGSASNSAEARRGGPTPSSIAQATAQATARSDAKLRNAAIHRAGLMWLAAQRVFSKPRNQTGYGAN